MATNKSEQKNNEKSADAGLLSEVDLLFETSWEVCNKIGGIYAVLSTKARVLKEQFDDRLVFIGPDVWSPENPSPYFKEKKTILKSALTKISLPWGIKIRTGRWDIPGSPQVILVNPGETASHLPEVYGKMWERFGVDSLHSYGDYEESCAFSVASSIVIKAIAAHMKVREAKVMAHFDEWTTGMGLLYTRLTMPNAATVFTTHATSIGRSICGNGKPLYDFFDGYNGDQMAEQLNMQSKHSLEKAAAHTADCFTTVSEVTARECKQLLEIKPQVVTPNGFEPNFVPKTVKYNKLRKEGRARLVKIANAMVNKEVYDDNTFFIATSGRHEYRNKGLDLFLDSVARIGENLPKGAKAVAFIFVPGWVKEPSGSLLMNLGFNGHDDNTPDFLTHRLNNEDSDEVCVRIRELENQGALDKIKIIYAPCYLDGNDGIFNIAYYDILPALDLTIFPSYYEPWGYTPMESVAFGVPTITDDKAGFGQWVADNFTPTLKRCGVVVIPRTDSNYQEACEKIASKAVSYIRESAAGRSEARHASFLTAAKADWQFFMQHYDHAFEVAIARRNYRRK
ncbi:glycosyltransferase [bacterium]|nr:glycosyltransferase [Bacteroides sp.]MBD5386897.1 glycosyltransferase [bacterium]